MNDAEHDPWLLTAIIDGDGKVLLRNQYLWGRVTAQMLADGGELNGKRILAPASVKLMTSNHLPPSLLTGEYGIGSQILVDLGITTMRVMTNNPAKYGGLEGYGLEIVERVPLRSRQTDEKIAYLRAKQEKMGHLLEIEDEGLGRS